MATKPPVIRATSSFLLACLLWALALAANPSLHEWAHGEHEEEGEHVCLATLLAAGGCDAPGTAAPVVAAPAHPQCALLALAEADAVAGVLKGCPLERGPPSPRI